MEMEMKILVGPSVNPEMIAKYHDGQTKKEVEELQWIASGSSFDVAKWLQTAGFDPMLVGFIGNDPVGHYLSKAIAQHNLPHYLFPIKTATSACFLTCSPDGAVSHYSYKPGYREITREEINEIRDKINAEIARTERRVDYRIVTGVMADDITLVEQVLFAGEGVRVLNPRTDFLVNLDRETIKRVLQETILCLNREEAAAFFEISPGEIGWQHVGAFHDIGVQSVIITIDGDGALISHQNERLHAPAPPQEQIVDPTGAGDAFLAGFIIGMIRKRDLKQIVECATYLASIACKHVGGMPQLTKTQQAEIRTRYEPLIAEE